MLTLARIIQPESGQQDTQPESSKKGWLQVVYKGEPRWARPCYAFGRFSPPDDLWLKKYAEKLAVWVTTERAELGEEDEDHLVYTGFLPLEDTLPTDIEDAFPQKQLSFSSRWELVQAQDANEPFLELRYTGDPDEVNAPQEPGATLFRISQKPGGESIKISQIIDGSPSGTSIELKPDKSIVLGIDGGLGMTLQNKDADAELTVGNGAVHPAIYERMNELWTQLKTWAASHVHPSPSGPTSPPAPTPPFPDMPVSVKGNKLKFPDN
ncbi:MAG TPA: hypothetical protein DCE42_19395 [Myxococcales bacterium]|nr:hypothetical protein [Deltaproteobacteria bacterium]MBU53496.1 hypothetical protein [Deltaproteobacteria bacterium]HAA56940.1 hypothetical protein [Myxococcales bacterium]